MIDNLIQINPGRLYYNFNSHNKGNFKDNCSKLNSYLNNNSNEKKRKMNYKMNSIQNQNGCFRRISRMNKNIK